MAYALGASDRASHVPSNVRAMTSDILPLAPTPAGLRRELEDLVVGDLLGPSGGDEETLPGQIRVRDRYLVGMLAPAGTVALDPERADGAAVNGDTAPARGQLARRCHRCAAEPVPVVVRLYVRRRTWHD